MTDRMQQVLDNLRRQIGDSQWDGFVEACYDAFEKYDQLDGENAVLFEQVQSLKRENDDMRKKLAEIELPKDAHGEIWHIGDKAYSMLIPELSPRTVCGLGVIQGRPVLFYLGKPDYGNWPGGWDYADSVAHEPDSWERILADAMGCEPHEVAEDDDLMKLVVRCKALCERTNGGAK